MSVGSHGVEGVRLRCKSSAQRSPGLCDYRVCSSGLGRLVGPSTAAVRSGMISRDGVRKTRLVLLRLRLRGRTLVGEVVEAVAEHFVSNPPDPSAFERGSGVEVKSLQLVSVFRGHGESRRFADRCRVSMARLWGLGCEVNVGDGPDSKTRLLEFPNGQVVAVRVLGDPTWDPVRVVPQSADEPQLALW